MLFRACKSNNVRWKTCWWGFFLLGQERNIISKLTFNTVVWFEFEGKQNFGQFDLKKVQQSCRKYWSPPLQLVGHRGGGGSQNFPFEKKNQQIQKEQSYQCMKLPCQHHLHVSQVQSRRSFYNLDHFFVFKVGWWKVNIWDKRVKSHLSSCSQVLCSFCLPRCLKLSF